ncbi:hypothetical protein [Rudaea sp.]|uniref:hypothetical protein n=1 Tax=Rudaea sp. TaxID=2136325 RepID=UPI003784D3EC
MSRPATLRYDVAVLHQMLRGVPKPSLHARNLEGFHGAQARDRGRFRERLLRGREELIRRLRARLPAQARIVELGGGTGRNLEFFGDRLGDVASFDLVDLCPARSHAHANVSRAIRWCAWSKPTRRPGGPMRRSIASTLPMR